MGCGTSTVLTTADATERRQRRQARQGQRAHATGLLQRQGWGDAASLSGRRALKKVAPEPADREAAAFSPGSPSFRFYCQKADAVAAAVAAADADDGDGNGCSETPFAIKKNEHSAQDITKSHNSTESKPKESRWLKLRALGIATASLYRWFSLKNSSYNNNSTDSAPAAARPHH